MQQILIIFLLVIVTAYWIDSVQVKELARLAGARECNKYNVQFLDNTVIKEKTRFRKHHANLLCFERHYTFDYSFDGEQRASGIIIMAGHYVVELQMDDHTFDNQDDA